LPGGGPGHYNARMRPSRPELEALTKNTKGRRRALIQALQDIQDRLHWLPPEALEHVAEALGVPLVQVYGVATFYKSFSLSPRGCHVRGGGAVLEEFERRLGIAAGRTTPDGAYTLERVNCLGACALAPLAVVDGRYHAQMTPAKVGTVLAAAEKGKGA